MKLKFKCIIKCSFLICLLMLGIKGIGIEVQARDHYGVFQTSEEEAWKRAISQNTLDAYYVYTIEYPQGKYYDEAVNKIVFLKEENAWGEAVTKNTSSSYNKYMKLYPYGLYLEDAKAASRRLAPSQPSSTVASNSRGNERPATSQPGTSTSTPPKREVVTSPPVKTERPPTNTPTATQKPVINQEEETWKNAKQSDTELAYKNYLTSYPNGKYVSQAIPKVPMELDLQRSNAVDSVFVLNVKYAIQPVSIRSIEIPREVMSFVPAETPESITTDTLFDGTMVKQYKWGEGRFSADITSLDDINTEVILTLGRQQKYELLLADNRNNTKTVELEGALSPLVLLGVLGYEPENDTLFLTIRGGKPDYYVRIVELGRDVNDFVHEEILKPDRYDNTWYLAKPDLIRENKITSGNYDVYIVDSRKLESIKYTRSVAFGTGHLLSNMEFRKFLLFPLAILVLLVLVRWIRSSRNSSGSRYRKFKF